MITETEEKETNKNKFEFFEEEAQDDEEDNKVDLEKK